MESSTFTRPERGALLELRVDALAYGGNGVARLDAGDGRGGYVVFVAGAVPGDCVRAVVTKRKRGYAEARTVELLEPSRERIAPRADHPGAPWQVLPYERQLAVKHEQVGDALTRIGRLDGFALDAIVPAVQRWRYRNKLEYSFGSDAAGELVCGFHAPGSWHEIVPIEDCMLASERSNAARDQVVGWCREQGLPAFDRRTHSGMLRNLVVREGRR
ncbi:MAG TPA: TRAM domain-containing protein, partial [Solirubrobacteraceae bacterium]|nr:TRAM domain-containing protein [Solirubrobacteraceae bacterium]